MPEPRLLTPSELEIMNALWSRGDCTVRDLLAQLGKGRAYTTVSTLVRILEQKGFVRSRSQGRRHLYRPTLSKPDYQSTSLRDLLARLFGGDASALVRSLLSTRHLTAADLAEIRRLLEER